MSILDMLAQAATQPQEQAPGWVTFLIQIVPFVAIFGFLYFFMFRAKKTQERKRTDMLATLKRGDRVQTIGGILGTVVEARENEILLKVDESSNTKIKFARSAIHRVVEEEKSETK